MNRKEFLTKSAIIGALGSTGVALASSSTNSLEIIGHNHIPNKEIKTMNTILHKANTRGNANHGWLNSHHSFSFANYYNADRMHFGALRVLNDDQVAPGRGFGTHPHENMEIVSIPLEGDLEHKDSMGNTTVIRQGDVQVMSAGTGIYHSEYNKNQDQDVKFLQIWVFPREKGVKPRYDQVSIKGLATKNSFYQVLSPNVDDAGVWAHQDAWFHLSDFDANNTDTYTVKKKGNGAYPFVLEGEVKVNGQKLEKRDGYGIWDFDSIDITSLTDAKVLLMEVPMI